MENIKKDVELNSHFLKAVDALSGGGVKFPKMILVGINKESDLIVIEGHLRLTVYMSRSNFIPNQLEAIIGYSENLGNWYFY